MGFLFLVSCWLFGGDVERLGDARFGVRHAAHGRLEAAGWLAYPALLTGSQSANPERARRCDDLMTALDAWIAVAADAEAVATGVAPLPGWADDAFLRAVCRRVDQLGGWTTADSWKWAKQVSYLTGTKWGDVDHVVRQAVARRTAVQLHPMLMPERK